MNTATMQASASRHRKRTIWAVVLVTVLALAAFCGWRFYQGRYSTEARASVTTQLSLALGNEGRFRQAVNASGDKSIKFRSSDARLIGVRALELRMEGTVMVFSSQFAPYEDASGKHLEAYVSISPDVPNVNTAACVSDLRLRDHGARFIRYVRADADCPALNLTHAQQERLARKGAWLLIHIAQNH